MAPPLDVCIRGAGIVGRTLALLLARERLRIGLVEAAPSPDAAPDVRAFALNAASRDLLAQVQAWPDEAMATPVTRMEVQGDRDGRVCFDAAAEGAPALAWIAEVAPLLQRLAEALRWQPQVELLAEPRPARLTVVCEGRTSSTRTEFGVPFDTQPYPQTAIAARLTCERPHGQVAHQWFGDGDVLAFLPLGGPQGNSVALVWSVLQSRADALLNLPAPEFESRLQLASQGRLGALRLSSARAAWRLQLAQAQHWCGPGWALAGDAAHNVHPLAGQGLNLGLADVRELVRVISEREPWRELGDMRLLRRYERSRKLDVQAMSLATDGLQLLFAKPQPFWASLRNWGLRGFDRSGPLKHWVARRAMGLP